MPRRIYEGWHPQVATILTAVDETFKWALFDRNPFPEWTQGRVALLGDACHPMLPFMAQGAAQAIEDGATLAACLKHSSLRHSGSVSGLCRIAQTASNRGAGEIPGLFHELPPARWAPTARERIKPSPR